MRACDSLDHDAALEIIIKMVTLTSLNLGRWPVTRLPEGQNRPKLPSHCFWLYPISEGLGDCKALINLDVSWCKKLEKLPESKKTVILLSFSYFAWNIIPHRLLFRFWHIAMPEGIGNLVHLETLNCEWCRSLVSIPESKIVYFLTLDLVFSLNHLWTILTHVYFCRNLRRHWELHFVDTSQPLWRTAGTNETGILAGK